MSDRKMQKLAFLVEIIVPDDFTIEQTQHDLSQSVQFGHPVITFRSQIKNYIDPARRIEMIREAINASNDGAGNEE